MRAVVTAPDPAWPDQFRQEAERVSPLLPGLVYLHHIGSTAVAGLWAKPVIDMMPVVQDIEAVDEAAPALAALGYEAMGEFGLPGRRYFRKGGDERSHHLHAYALGHPDIARHLAFRDFLRTHADVRDRYGALKRRLAAEVGGDIERYMEGKDGFIKATEQLALAWWQPFIVIALSGPVGVGKTTVLAALGDLLREAGVAHALIDRDALTEFWPRAPGDPFAQGYALAMIGQLARQARDSGARCLIVAGVLETPADADRLAGAIPSSRLHVVQLEAPLPVLEERLHRRESGPGLTWHLKRASTLLRQLERGGPEALTVDATPSPAQVAAAVLEGTQLVTRLSAGEPVGG